MGNKRLILGRSGEAAALSFLKKHGYHILETNWRARQAEIDIIAKQKDTLCFIEVKTRQTLNKGLPREAVTPLKQRKILTGATLYLKKNKLFDSKIRFDVIEVFKKDNQFDIQLIPHAFQAQ
jgi:putative endonuclease